MTHKNSFKHQKDIKNDKVTFSYNFDLDENGVFFWLGS